MTAIAAGAAPIRMPRVPASFFGIVLGLSGLASCWRAAHDAWGAPAAIGETLFILAAIAWLVIATLFGLKWMFVPHEARVEAEHPVQCCFIGLAGVSTLLIAQGALRYDRVIAVALFFAGAAFTLGFALWRTGTLWRGQRDPGVTTPVLYLPSVAGGLVTGATAAALGWSDWGQLAFGAGVFSWLAIESVLLHRLYTAETLPVALRPTLGIQLAPPAVASVCYLAVSGRTEPDLIAHALIGYAILQALLLGRMWRWIAEQPFSPSYWAFTFGATAVAGSTIRLSTNPGSALAILSPVLFAAANILVVVVAMGTAKLLFQGRLVPATIPTR